MIKIVGEKKMQANKIKTSFYFHVLFSDVRRCLTFDLCYSTSQTENTGGSIG
jgi:hypothetical protein